MCVRTGKRGRKGVAGGRVNRNAQRRRLSTQPSSKETKGGGWKKEKRASLLLSTSLSLFFPNASTVALLEKKIARLLCAEKGRGWGGGARKEDCCFLLLSDCWTESMMMLPSPPSLPSPPPSAQIRRVYVYFLPPPPAHFCVACRLRLFRPPVDVSPYYRTRRAQSAEMSSKFFRLSRMHLSFIHLFLTALNHTRGGYTYSSKKPLEWRGNKKFLKPYKISLPLSPFDLWEK